MSPLLKKIRFRAKIKHFYPKKNKQTTIHIDILNQLHIFAERYNRINMDKDITESPIRIMSLTQSDNKTLAKEVLPLANIYGFVLCLKGTIGVSTTAETFTMKERDLCFCLPTHQINNLSINENAEALLVTVRLAYILPILNRALGADRALMLGLEPCVSMTERNNSILLKTIDTLQYELTEWGNTPKDELIYTLRSEFIYSLTAAIANKLLCLFFVDQSPKKKQQMDRQDAIFQNFMLHLMHDFREHRDITYYADKQNITSRYFSGVIKSKSGEGPLYWINNYVINEAKQLLENTNMSNKEISLTLNFTNLSFFGKYFRQHVGVSPQKYRMMKNKVQ